MTNIYDYIKWRGDLEFERDPFNPVDNIIFSQLSYLPMEDIVPGPDETGNISIEEAGEISAEKHKKIISGFNIDITIKNGVSVLQAIKAAPRYKNCMLFGFVNNTDFQQDKQFAAYCARIEKKKSANDLVVVFRGTDMNLAGWKEDMNMSLNNSIPAQKEAVTYLEKIAELFPDPLIVAGHSKGGNLAVYASAFCKKSVQKRINIIFSNDGPGFHNDIIQNKGYQAICGKICGFIPQGALVGMLFEHGETPYVIKSNAIGIMQHDMSTWEVTHNNFIGAELTHQSRFIDKVIREWLDEIDIDQREQFIGAIYAIITSGNAQSISDFTDWKNNAEE